MRIYLEIALNGSYSTLGRLCLANWNRCRLDTLTHIYICNQFTCFTRTKGHIKARAISCVQSRL